MTSHLMAFSPKTVIDGEKGCKFTASLTHKLQESYGGSLGVLTVVLPHLAGKLKQQHRVTHSSGRPGSCWVQETLISMVLANENKRALTNLQEETFGPLAQSFPPPKENSVG